MSADGKSPDEGQGPNYGGDRGMGNKTENTSPDPIWNRNVPLNERRSEANRRNESHGTNHPWPDSVNMAW